MQRPFMKASTQCGLQPYCAWLFDMNVYVATDGLEVFD